jgi:oligoribonuclease
MGMIFCFLDVETTGLDPERCALLEVACALTNEDLVPFASFEQLIPVPLEMLHPTHFCWDHAAYQMHRASGLLDELIELSRGHREGETLYEFLSDHVGSRKANLAGNSVHFDRSFLTRVAPEILSFFTHRHLDVSSLRLAAEALGLPRYDGAIAHRAMPDVLSSIAQARYYLNLLRNDGGRYFEEVVCHA